MKFDRKAADDLADEVLQKFKSGSTPSNAIKESAIINDLNIEQIKRVCEASNVKIKKHLHKEASNPAFTFPLADWRDVITDFQPVVNDESYEKTASVYLADEWEEFEEVLTSGMEKEAGVEQEPEASVDILADTAMRIENADHDLRREQAKCAHELQHVSEKLVDTIQDRYRVNDGVDDLYTIALKKTAQSQHAIVRTLFDEAKDRYEDLHGASLPDFAPTKLAGVINHNSRFVKTLRQYIITRDKLIKTAQTRHKLSKAKSRITNRLHEIMLGDE